MRRRPWHRVRRRLGLILVLTAAGQAPGCGNDPIDALEDDPTVVPFVGDWRATELLLTNDADPDGDPVDVLAQGGSFTINVQPSGTYTATLAFPGLPPAPEIGDLTVVEGSLVLTPSGGGPPAVSEFEFEGPDRVILDGPTRFDFNLDGTPEDAHAHIVLERI